MFSMLLCSCFLNTRGTRDPDADLDSSPDSSNNCPQGERFCDGHWGGLIEDGHLQRLLARLAELAD